MPASLNIECDRQNKTGVTAPASLI